MSIDSVLKAKSLEYAKCIVKLYQYLAQEKQEYILSKQVLRSGTSIGANIAEAIYGSSRKDFSAKLSIAQKECAETLYWLELLYSCDHLPENLYHSLNNDCSELIAMLAASIKKLS